MMFSIIFVVVDLIFLCVCVFGGLYVEEIFIEVIF